jgi:hypothetical protein
VNPAVADAPVAARATLVLGEGRRVLAPVSLAPFALPWLEHARGQP